MSEDDLKLDISPESTDDENRRELMWEKREEDLLVKWKNDMCNKSIEQGKSARKIKKLYSVLGLPATLLPIIMSGLTKQLEEYEILQSLLMIATGSLIGISTFFNLGKKTALHFEYEHKYSELALTIDKELTKPKKYRIALDVFLENISLKYIALDERAPNTL